jgi:hypothetical protein
MGISSEACFSHFNAVCANHSALYTPVLRFGFVELRPACTAWVRWVVEPKLNFDCRWYNHGFAVLRAGAEPPLLHRLNGFLVETRTKTALKSNIVGSAVGVDLDVQDDCSLDVGPRRFRCVLGRTSRNYCWRLGQEVGLRMERQPG